MSNWTKDDEIRSGMMQGANNRTEQLAARVLLLETKVLQLETIVKLMHDLLQKNEASAQ